MSLQIETLATGLMNANCYLVYDDHTLETTIIDPGDDGDYIIKYLSDLELKPVQILLTHGHFDHHMAGFTLQSQFSIPTYLHALDVDLVKKSPASVKKFIGIEPDPPIHITDELTESTSLNIAGITCRTFHTPGHTPGSCVFYLRDADLAFVGDLIFAGGGIGRYDFSYSSEVDLLRSIKKILNLPEATVLYPGHGPTTTIQAEKQLHEL